MKNIIIILLLGISVSSYGQKNSSSSKQKTPKYSEDSKIEVIYNRNLMIPSNLKVAYFIDGNFTHTKALSGINPNTIESIDVVKNAFEKDGENYTEKVIVKTKSDCKLRMITISEIYKKYFPKETTSAIFQIGNNIVSENNNIIDENYILKIELSKIKTIPQQNEINFVKITTKTRENIEKANNPTIKIRGANCW